MSLSYLPPIPQTNEIFRANTPPSSQSVSPKQSPPVLISASDERRPCASDLALSSICMHKIQYQGFSFTFIERIDLVEPSCCDWAWILLYLGRLETRGFFSRKAERKKGFDDSVLKC
jgi:hypothetical protein